MTTDRSNADSNKPVVDSDYPEQRHAGKVGYGPNYHAGASVADRIAGFTEELHGKIIHNPELVKEGHEKHTGEAKRRKALGLDEKEPVFGEVTPKGSSPSAPGVRSPGTRGARKSLASPGNPATESGSDVPKVHAPTAKEQAATVTPQASHGAGVTGEERQ